MTSLATTTSALPTAKPEVPFINLGVFKDAAESLTDHANADQEHDDVAAAVLTEVIALAMPALPLLNTYPTVFADADSETKYQHSCITLAGGAHGPDWDEWEIDPAAPTSAETGGWVPTVYLPIEYFFLRSDGKLLQFTYHRLDEHGENSDCKWTAACRVYPSALAAIQDGWWEVTRYVRLIEAALARAIEPAKRGSANLRARSARLQAALTVLRAK